MSNPDPRFADIITAFNLNSDEPYDVVLFGIPTDEGIRRNGGRIGASHAPNAIRSYLRRLTPNSRGSAASLRIADAGDAVGDTLEELHLNAAKQIEQIVPKAKTVIVLGGGHDITLPSASGFASARANTDFALMNIDAHLDVRPTNNGLHHSGSSFRLLLESGILSGRHFTEFGIQDYSYAAEHLHWVVNTGAEVVWYADIRASMKSAAEQFAERLAKHKLDYYISFDIDAVRASDAPGCSAPSPIGLTADEAVAIASVAGQELNVKVFDIVEVSPGYDVDGHTCRLAARMAAAFISGVSSR